jgi:tRNA(Ile2) C34 agmatinyltransferase TiaS
MPHFLCPRCALRAYSAAGESRCPSCGTPLRGNNQLHPSIPRGESLSRGRAGPVPAEAGRFRRVSSGRIPQAGR